MEGVLRSAQSAETDMEGDTVVGETDMDYLPTEEIRSEVYRIYV